DRIESIKNLQIPNSRKELKSFFGKINFVRKFITGFAEIVQPLNAMLKKDAQMEWMPVAKAAFEDIKEAISDAPVLASPDYTCPFYIYSFASSHSVAAALTQKSENDDERPIAFMSAPLKDAQLRYLDIER
ncbi:MAG TPA: ribonuclease H family protein, partial [Puia sp.]|nr:ribonuclease H family protein [Puia sp.]